MEEETHGAINYSVNLYEKDINFKLAKYLQEELSKYYNVKVILTHDGVNFPNNDYNDLAARAMVARNNNADLYVSLHINSTTSSSVNGSNVYVTYRTDLPKYKEGTTILANKILQNLSNLGIKNNGVLTKLCIDDSPDPKYRYYDKQLADYYADIRHAMKGDTKDYGADLRDGSGVPAVLIEHCYMSSNNDLKFVNSDSAIKKLAQADAKAIVEYLELKLPTEVVSSITVDKQDVNLVLGEQANVTATVNPATAPDKSVSWISSNNNVATVDANGQITSTGVGTAQIAVKSNVNPAISTTITVNVQKYDLNLETAEKCILVNKQEKLTVNVTPTWITAKTFEWESDNPEIVEVANDGTIIAKKSGIANITVTWQEQNLSKTMAVEVIELPVDTKIEIINYAKNNKYLSKIGEKVTVQDFLSNIKLSDNLEVITQIPNAGQTYIGTNTKVIIREKAHSIPVEEYECLIYGDVNGDGKISAMDYAYIKNHIMNVQKITDTNMQLAADVSGDGKISAMDYAYIKNHIMNVQKISLK